MFKTRSFRNRSLDGSTIFQGIQLGMQILRPTPGPIAQKLRVAASCVCSRPLVLDVPAGTYWWIKGQPRTSDIAEGGWDRVPGICGPWLSVLLCSPGPRWTTSDFERECEAQPFVSSHQTAVLAAVDSQGGMVGYNGAGWSSLHISGHMWSLG